MTKLCVLGLFLPLLGWLRLDQNVLVLSVASVSKIHETAAVTYFRGARRLPRLSPAGLSEAAPPQWPRGGGQCREVETKKNKRNPSSSWGPCCCWPGFCVSGLFGDWVVRWIHRWNICLNSGRSYTWDPHVVIFPTMKAEECRNLTNLVLLPSNGTESK